MQDDLGFKFRCNGPPMMSAGWNSNFWALAILCYLSWRLQNFPVFFRIKRKFNWVSRLIASVLKWNAKQMLSRMRIYSLLSSMFPVPLASVSAGKNNQREMVIQPSPIINCTFHERSSKVVKICGDCEIKFVDSVVVMEIYEMSSSMYMKRNSEKKISAQSTDFHRLFVSIIERTHWSDHLKSLHRLIAEIREVFSCQNADTKKVAHFVLFHKYYRLILVIDICDLEERFSGANHCPSQILTNWIGKGKRSYTSIPLCQLFL